MPCYTFGGSGITDAVWLSAGSVVELLPGTVVGNLTLTQPLQVRLSGGAFVVPDYETSVVRFQSTEYGRSISGADTLSGRGETVHVAPGETVAIIHDDVGTLISAGPGSTYTPPEPLTSPPVTPPPPVVGWSTVKKVGVGLGVTALVIGAVWVASK